MNLKLLKEKIEKSGLTKQELAKKLDICPQVLYRKLKGDVRFNTNDVMQLCEILGIDSFSERVDIFLSLPFQK